MGMRVGILLILFLSCNLYSADRAYFDKLKAKVNLQNDEQLVILYQQIGSCIKCYLIPLEKIPYLIQEGKLKKYKIIALVLCERDIELNIFKKQTNWKYYLYRDDGKSRKRLSISENTNAAVFDCRGKFLFEF